MAPDPFPKARIAPRRAGAPRRLAGRGAGALLASALTRMAPRWRCAIGARSVSAFHPVRDEPDTLAAARRAGGAGVATALPVTGARGEPLVFRRWRPGEPTVAGQMRIPEPPPEAAALDPDLLFVPLAAFDRRGHRIGYGAGHYDCTLARLQGAEADRRRRRRLSASARSRPCRTSRTTSRSTTC